MTTIYVPASEPAAVQRPEGDPGEADALSRALHRGAAGFDQVSDVAAGVRVVPGWTGDAAQSYASSVQETAGEHQRLVATLGRVSRAVSVYADELRELRHVADDLEEQKAALDGQRRDLLADIEATREATPEALAMLRGRATSLGASYDRLVSQHDALVRRTQQNEDLLRQAFTSATGLSRALAVDAGAGDTASEAMGRPGAPGRGASPEQVADWWQGLSEAQRTAVLAAYPEVLGGADGLPAGVRDDANRLLLDGDLALLEAQESAGALDHDERRHLDNARATERALRQTAEYVDPLTGERPGGQLWLYDPRAFGGDGRVAVSVGDLDTAEDVGVFTPGITTDMRDVEGYATQMSNLYESTRFNGDGSSVATMFWLGYDAPHGPVDPATFTEGRAEDGGRRLADSLDGLRASRRDDPAHLTAIGHSYGSTTTSYAVGGNDVDVDDLVLIGSPGAGPADDAGDFGLGSGQVYVGRDSRDMVAWLGDEGWVGKGGLGLGRDPSEDEFGAVRFESERHDRGAPGLLEDHTSYLDHDTESLYNLGRIVDGHGDEVNRAQHSYDPWHDDPRDPEWDREPTTGLPGRSQTRGVL